MQLWLPTLNRTPYFDYPANSPLIIQLWSYRDTSLPWACSHTHLNHLINLHSTVRANVSECPHGMAQKGNSVFFQVLKLLHTSRWHFMTGSCDRSLTLHSNSISRSHSTLASSKFFTASWYVWSAVWEVDLACSIFFWAWKTECIQVL